VDNPEPDIGEILQDRERIDRAMRRAVREALRRHKLLGNPVADWRDGKVVWIPPEEIVIDEENEP
jgi:Arc/MetJ family transcription regulator